MPQYWCRSAEHAPLLVYQHHCATHRHRGQHMMPQRLLSPAPRLYVRVRALLVTRLFKS